MEIKKEAAKRAIEELKEEFSDNPRFIEMLKHYEEEFVL